MCIRDRTWIGSNPIIISTTGIIEAPAKPKQFYIDIMTNTSKAVSYTHLRAHETKANLVCRLLLEKKKKNKNKKTITKQYKDRKQHTTTSTDTIQID